MLGILCQRINILFCSDTSSFSNSICTFAIQKIKIYVHCYWNHVCRNRHRLSDASPIPPWINQAITALIWLLLFLLGIEVGHNEQIIRSLPTLGVEAFTIAIVCVLGSCLAAWGLWKYVNRRKEEKV